MPHPPMDRALYRQATARTKIEDAVAIMQSKPLPQWSVIELADMLVLLEFSEADPDKGLETSFSWLIRQFRAELSRR